MLLQLIALVLLAGGALQAQDLTGNWQGTLRAGKDHKDLRMILVITRDDAKLQAKLYSIDETAQPFVVSSISQEGSTLKFAIDLNGTSYEGKLNADASRISGTWTQAVTATPMDFVRPTKETAWAIPAPPALRKPMASDAEPGIDVATIKPNDSGGASLQVLTFRGRSLVTVNSSLADLMMFAYSVQRKQIVGAPDWIDRDRYDIVATPDQEGTPTAEQVRIMIRKLLADRFELTFHHDQREFAAYVLTVAKDRPNLKPGQPNGNLHGIGIQPAKTGAMLFANNAPIPAFTSFLQSLVFDRPVVDRTGLTGRYDITITFTPDDSLFSGHSPVAIQLEDGVEPAPRFFDAIQQQLGLKLTSEKAMVEVLAVDRVAKPSAN